MNNVLLSSKSNEWQTPKHLYDLLNDEFHFVLDPASTEKNHLCNLYYTIENSGLINTWDVGGSVFCNPPYGRTLHKWIEKAYFEWINGCGDIVLLIPARTDTNYFHDYILNKAEIRFIRGRISFYNPYVYKLDRSPFPSMLVIYRNNGECKLLSV